MAIEMEKWVNKNKFWFALVTALNYGGTNVCLSILHDDSISSSLPRDPKLLFRSLRKHKGFFYNMLKHGVISLNEYNLLFNSDEEVDSRQFDLGLIITLLQGLVLSEPNKGWLHPDPEDTSVSAFIVQLRKFKDKINGMKVNAVMSENEFHDLWDELNEILHALFFDTALINEIYLTTTRDIFVFPPPFDQKFASAFNSCKHIYLLKVVTEVRELYDRHTENVTTVMTVVRNQKISKIYSDTLRLQKSIANMYRLYEDFMYFQTKDAAPMLTACEQLTLSIELNDESLDKVIAEYNSTLDAKEMLNKKDLVEHNKNQTEPKNRAKYFTLQKTAVMSWLRRNTLKSPPTKEELAAAFIIEDHYTKSSPAESSYDRENQTNLIKRVNYKKSKSSKSFENKIRNDSKLDKEPCNDDNAGFSFKTKKFTRGGVPQSMFYEGNELGSATKSQSYNKHSSSSFFY